MIHAGLHASKRSRTRGQFLAQDPHNLDIALRKSLRISPPDWQSARVTQARRRHEQGQSQEALRILQQEAPSESLSVMTLYAEIYTALNDYEAALKAYQYLLDNSQAFYELHDIDQVRMRGLAYMNMAWLEQQREHHDTALRYYSESIELLRSLHPLQTPALLNSLMTAYQQRGQVHRKQQKVELALQDLRHSMKYQQLLLQQDINENLVKDWLDLGQLQLEQGDTEAARRSLQTARHDWQYLPLSEADQLVKPLQHFEAQLATACGEFESASKIYNKLAEKSKSLTQKIMYLLMALASLFKHSTEEGLMASEALKPLVVALESQPNVLSQEQLTLPLLAAAELCENHHHASLALDYYQFALRAAAQGQQAPQQTHWLQAAAGRARMLEQQGDFTRAIQAYRDIVRHLQGHIEVSQTGEFLLKLALCYQQGGKIALAEKTFGQIIAEHPAPAQADPEDLLIRALYFRGFFYVLEKQDLAQAQTDFERIESYLPGYAAYDLACLACGREDIETAFGFLHQHLASPYALPLEDIQTDTDLLPLHSDVRWQTLTA